MEAGAWRQETLMAAVGHAERNPELVFRIAWQAHFTWWGCCNFFGDSSSDEIYQRHPNSFLRPFLRSLLDCHLFGTTNPLSLYPKKLYFLSSLVSVSPRYFMPAHDVDGSRPACGAAITSPAGTDDFMLQLRCTNRWHNGCWSNGMCFRMMTRA